MVAWSEKFALMGCHFHSLAEIREMIAGYGLSTQIERDGRFAARIVADK